MKLIFENWRRFLNEQEKTPIHIFFDMDGVLVDFAGSLAKRINDNLSLAGQGSSLEDIHPKSKSSRNMLKKLIKAGTTKVTPEQLEEINFKKDTGGDRSALEKLIGNYLMSLIAQGEQIWLDMKKVEGSGAMVEAAKQIAGDNVYVLSSPVDEASITAKKKWIEKHFPNSFPEERVIITGEKGEALKKLGILKRNEIPILIDDRIKYLNQFYINGGQTIHHTPAGSAGVANTLSKLKQPWVVQKPRTHPGQELVLHNGLILKISPPKNIEQLIQGAQEKYSQILPEGEKFTKIGKLHITLILAPVWKNLTFEQKQNIIQNLKLPEGIVDTNQVFLAARKLEGRKTLYLKANSDALNQALKQVVPELPDRYMHLSIANVHGGDSFKSVGDINASDEGEQKNIVPAAQKQKEKKPQREKPGGQDNPVEFAKGLVNRGLPAEQIKNIIMKKFKIPEHAALGIMKGAGVQ